MDVGKILAGMGYLILVFLLLTRSREVSTIIKSAGGFITQQTTALQGVDITGNARLIGGGGNGVGISYGGANVSF